MMRLPGRRHRNSGRSYERRCPGHCAWVRGHSCSVPGCDRGPIECAHVRSCGDGGVGLKPSDRNTISLCHHHHAEQHRIGESAFQTRYGVDLVELARMFDERSPHRGRWMQKQR